MREVPASPLRRRLILSMPLLLAACGDSAAPTSTPSGAVTTAAIATRPANASAAAPVTPAASVTSALSNPVGTVAAASATSPTAPAVGTLAAASSVAGAPIRGSGDVNATYAATLVGTFENHVGPAFSTATGFKFLGEGKGSIALANEIKGKVRTPDIYVSADVSVNETLRGPANGNYVSWWVPFATTEMVIGWSPKSRFAPDFEAAKAGTKTWESVLAQPGLRFGRTDPEIDPKGYRTIFLFKLDEERTGDATLSQKILGQPVKPAQTFLEEQLVARLQTAELDAGVFFKVEAIEAKLPYLTLPKEINQGDVSLADHYATATYTNKQGTTYTGSPIIYTVTIPSTVRNRPGASSFVQFLLGKGGQDELAAQGLQAIAPVVSGDPASVPPELASLVKTK